MKTFLVKSCVNVRNFSSSAGNSMGGLSKVPQFMFNDDPTGQLTDDGTLDQTVPSLGSPVNTSPGSERIERFSRKVFVGGLPPDIDEGTFCIHI